MQKISSHHSGDRKLFSQKRRKVVFVFVDSKKTMSCGNNNNSNLEIEYIKKHHIHQISDNQCTSVLLKHIKAPVHLVFLTFSLFTSISPVVVFGLIYAFSLYT